MRTATRILMTALALMLGVAVPAVAQSDDPEAYADSYLNGDYGRIRFQEGGATIVRADGDTDAGERAGVNAPIFPGDTLRTDGGGRAEIQLADGTLLRLDRDTEVAFQALPEPGAKYQDNSVLVLSSGTLRIAHRGSGKDEFRIDTRDASVYLLEEGDVRIDADGRGGTRVTSLRGVAEVVGNDSSVLVRGGTGTTVVQGSAPAEPRPYSAFASDGFDRWCASRDAAYRPNDQVAQGDDRSQVPAEVRPYYNELSVYGSWANVPTYGNVWCPRGVGADWRPYSSGYWNYGPGGYFWVSSEPWGWAPYHYGNWQWVPGYGWCWIPGSVFAGAWVSWSWGSAYIGWAPLDFWGRPGWIGGPYYYGYYDPGCWSFVSYNNIYASNVHRYAVPVGSISPDDLRHANVVTRPPRVDPRHFAGSRELRQKALLETAQDRSGRMRPLSETDLRTRPSRTLDDIRTQIVRREAVRAVSPRGNAPQPSFSRPSAPGNGSRTQLWNDARPQQQRDSWARPRRILEDPRGNPPSSPQRRVYEESDTSPRSHVVPGGAERRPSGSDGVRDLYQRMSRPRETRPQEIAPETQRRSFVPQRSQPQPQRVEPQRQQPQRMEPQRQQPQRVEPQRQQPPRQQPQRVQPRPQRAEPRPQPQRGQGGGGQARPNQGQGHGGGNDKHH